MEKRREFLKLGLAGAANLVGVSASLGAPIAPKNLQNFQAARPLSRYIDKQIEIKRLPNCLVMTS